MNRMTRGNMTSLNKHTRQTKMSRLHQQPKTVLKQTFFSYLRLLCVYFRRVLSVPCSRVVTCWERADLLALLCVMFSCVFVTHPYEVMGQVWYLIVSIPDLCLLSYLMKVSVF